VPVATDAGLLERSRELNEIGHALMEARRGHGRIILVEAAAGLGKTSLLKLASEMAAEAGFTCCVRASELERDFAFGCSRQWLEPVVARATESERERLFEGAAALPRSLLQPSLASQPSPTGDRFFFNAARSVLAAQQSRGH
jgi:hypothetical protein